MALFDERILEKEKPILKKKKTSKSLLFDEKEKKKEKLPEVKKSVADIIPIIDQTDSGLFQLKDEGSFFGIWQLKVRYQCHA
ncbi:hypothetical protein ASE46_24750 [Bacillus sp. Root239]|nr:hypothetical protein ASE46_24750 [Bacillus sp. Root239]